MEQARKWSPYLIIALLLVATIFLITKGCKGPIDPGKTTTDTIYVKGKSDTIYIPGKPDTVTKYVPYPVYVETPKGDHFGKDSSAYTVLNESGRVEVMTYPATDSIRVEIEPVAIERLITQVDSIMISRVDTMKIHTTTTIDQPWYNTFLSGFVSAILAVAGVIGAFVL